MAPRANWKGFLRLSLVTCPVALFPTTSERRSASIYTQLKVDAETGDEVPNEDIVKGYEFDKGQYIEVSKDELEEIALESTRTIEIDEFVARSDIDPRYLIQHTNLNGEQFWALIPQLRGGDPAGRMTT